MKTSFSKLWKSEDWLAIWIGFILIFVAGLSVLSGTFDFTAAKYASKKPVIDGKLERGEWNGVWLTADTEDRVYFESGAVYFLDPVKGCVAYERIQDGRGTQFIAMDMSDVKVGDTIAYYAPGNGILCILVLD